MTFAATKTARGQAGGKIILLGEHAVVHGSKAVALGLPRGVEVTARVSEGPLRLMVSQWNRTVEAGDGTPEGKALEEIARSLRTGPCDASMEAHFQIPIRAGLGSSAALAGAVARALTALRGLPDDPESLFHAVQASEKVFHGNPSGLDARTSLSGGIITFSRGAGSHDLDVPLPRLGVFYSGQPGDTKTTVAQFSKQLEEKEGQSRFQRISELAELAIAALLAGDVCRLGELMYENHEHLNWFGVSSPSLNKIVDLARQCGAKGAKLTGGGGGGCAIVLADSGLDGDELLQKIADAGFQQVVL